MGKKGENNIKFADKTAIRSTKLMISPLGPKVKALADFAAHRGCSVV
jgi:hypothetical protein